MHNLKLLKAGYPPSFQHFTSIININFRRKVRWQTGNGANFSLFWERDAKGILTEKAEVIISGAFFFGSFLFGLTKRNEHIKKKVPF